MKYFLLYVIAPTGISFLVQSILCRKGKRRMLRHGALFFPLISAVAGIIILLTQCRGPFGGLSGIAALLWLTIACCSFFGYGLAWFVFLLMKKKGEGSEKNEAVK